MANLRHEVYVHDGTDWNLINPIPSLSDLGITVAASEINYLSGATSNIQNQIDTLTNSISATNAEALKITKVEPTSAVYYTFILTESGSSGTAPATGYKNLKSYSLAYIWTDGTRAMFCAGNSGTNLEGGFTLWKGSYHIDLRAPSSLTANRDITFPNASGTVALEGHTHSIAWNQITNSGAQNISEGTSDFTDNTEIFSSYASNNGFADTNAPGAVYRRDAIKMYNYIKNKLTPVAIANGGTGATTAAAARANLATPYMVTETYPALVPTNASNNWIKIGTANTSYGILPSQSGSAGSGHNYIGTSSWYWKYCYVDEYYGNWKGTAIPVANGGTGATTAAAARTNLGAAASSHTHSTLNNSSATGTLNSSGDFTIGRYYYGTYANLTGSGSETYTWNYNWRGMAAFDTSGWLRTIPWGTILYNGSFASGSATLTNALTYKVLVLVGAMNGGSRSSMTIPTSVLTTSDINVQMTDETYWITVSLKKSGYNVIMTYYSRNGSSYVQWVGGFN